MVRHSAPEALRALIENGEYESALAHCAKYGLDADDVYKSRWGRSDFGQNAIQQNLPYIEDRKWVINQCLRRVGTTAEGASALISYGLAETDAYRHTEQENAFYMIARLRLLQFRDRLDTFMGIHMGRFSSKKYMIFRSAKLQKVATSFAEDGKTGALELLIKRHTYTLGPSILSILDAIPETLSPHSYAQLIPEVSPLKPLLPRRGQDWVESENVLHIISKVSGVSGDSEVDLSESTEYVAKLSTGLAWPDEREISSWYQRRARKIDELSGQLENSLFLLDSGLQKGIPGLDTLWKDVADLCRISFSIGDCQGEETELTLATWEALDPYEKFKLMLKGVNEDTVVDRLMEFAVLFVEGLREKNQSFLLRYLKEMSGSNLKLCAVVLEDACKRPYKGALFKDEAETVTAGIECIYGSKQTDQWELMASILSKLPWEDETQLNTDDVVHEKEIRRGFVRALRHPRTYTDSPFPRAPLEASTIAKKKHPAISEELEGRIKQAEGHIQAGKILFQYQISTTISFLVSAHEDVKGTKQMLRILLSKFSRRYPSKSDGEWAALWRDLQILHEKAFPFLEKDYILFEFCRGLLKAGKFSLAKSYFRDSGAFLTTEKVENLVIQISREYFYSANSLDSPDIERAKECLNLLPASKAANAEYDIIVAVTEKLPYLGVNLLPQQFRQIKEPMEVLKMAIDINKGSDIPVRELLEVAKLLGFNSTNEMAAVEEALAREAAAYGNVGLAQKLCLELAKKGYGKIWDLCVAIGRGPEAEQLDLQSRKQLIGFALRHCDDESISELLDAWKEFDSVDAEVASPEGSVVESDNLEEQYEEVAKKEDSDMEQVPEEALTDARDDSSTHSSTAERVECKTETPTQKSNDIILKNFEEDVQVSEADLASIESAFQCFSKLAPATSSKEQAVALKSLLEVWEVVFKARGQREGLQGDDEGWEVKGDEEGWGDGWQDFEIGETETSGLSELHGFWKITCDKLLQNQCLEELISAFDKSSASLRALLNEEEARHLVESVAQENVLVAAKLALLLPYESLRSPYLNRVEDELQRQTAAADSALLVLVLSAGLLPSVAGDSRLNGLFSALCRLVAEKSDHLPPQIGCGDELGAASLSVVMPYFIAELTRRRFYGVASSMVLQHMRVPLSFATWNVSNHALKRYLEAQQAQQRQKREHFEFGRLCESSLSYISETISRLVASFEPVVAEALTILSKDLS